jgi:hypothetical protein
LEDLLSPEDHSEFNNLSEEARAIPITGKNYNYASSIYGFYNNPEWPFKVDGDERYERLKKIKDLNLRDTQRWYESTPVSFDRIKFKLQSIVNNFVKNFYPGIDPYHQDAVSVYVDGDHSEIHRDGQNTGRVCVVLAYLTPEEEYNDSGDLIIVGDDQPSGQLDNPFRVKPVRGNVAMLDFIKHNPFHGVLPVNPEFVRHCYISFVWDKNIMPDNIKLKGY